MQGDVEPENIRSLLPKNQKKIAPQLLRFSLFAVPTIPSSPFEPPATESLEERTVAVKRAAFILVASKHNKGTSNRSNKNLNTIFRSKDFWEASFAQNGLDGRTDASTTRSLEFYGNSNPLMTHECHSLFVNDVP